MALPTLDIRVNFDRLGVSRIANDGFETDTSGWSVTAGIQAAATSITRTVAAPYMGTAVGRLVTTATSGSGVKYVMSSTFTSGVTYRFRVWLKSVSGTTSALIRIGSLGTVGDRATAAITLTTSWVAYSVDFTPSADRTDVQVNVTTNAAAIMTADIDDAEVYNVSDDVLADADLLIFDHGANFEGGLQEGQLTLQLRNWTGSQSKYTGAAALSLALGMPIYARASYLGVPYGLFYGIIKRVSANAAGRMVTVLASDPVATWTHSQEINIATSTTRSIASFRGAILDALGEPAARRSLSLAEAEADIPVTGADAADALSLLGSLDASTGTVGFLAFDPQPSVLYQYTTKPRNLRSAQAAAATLPDEFIGLTGETSEDVLRTVQRVSFNLPIISDTAVAWTADGPVNVASGETRTIWASFGEPVVNQAISYTATNGPTITLTPFNRSAKIVIVGPVGGTLVTNLLIVGNIISSGAGQSVLSDSGAAWPVIGSEIAATYVPSAAAAQGLADWWTGHFLGTAREDYGLENHFPTQLAVDVCDRILAHSALLGDGADHSNVVRSINTTVLTGAAEWLTTYGCEPIITVGSLFTLGTSALGGSDVLGI